MPSMTKEQIAALRTSELRSIVRSTVSTSCSSYWQETLWARDELARRNRLRNGIKEAIVNLGGTVTASEGRSSDRRFAKTYCSQCGQEFGPGDSGFSHCQDHQEITR